MKKHKIVLLFSSLIFAFLICVSSSYAWYIIYKDINNIQLQILQIDSQISLYQALDDNANGAPNKLDEDNTFKKDNSYVEYNYPYYIEDNAFAYVDTKYALSSDSSANTLFDISVDNACPSQIFTFKYEIINYCGMNNVINFDFLSSDDARLSCFEVRMMKINVNDATTINDIVKSYTYNNNEWKSFVSGEALSVVTDEDNFNIPPTSKVINKKNNVLEIRSGRCDLWLQIKMKDDVTQYENETISFPYARLTLKIEAPTQE